MGNVITTGISSRRVEKETNTIAEREFKMGASRVYFCGGCKMEIKTTPFFIKENDVCPYCHASLGENIEIYSSH
ncbi:MAG: hypothetical protein AAB696_01775 [Patescibacteria group bacterium]